MVSRLLRRSGISVVEICEERLKWRPEVVIQVGIGQYHREIDVMREVWGDDFRLYGFEPHPELAIEVSKDYSGEVYPVAIGDHSGSITLYYRPKHKDGANVFGFDENPEEQKKFEVLMVTLDQYCKNWDLADYQVMLWLDCEGSELRALKGARKMLSQVEVINIEMTANPRCKGWADTVETHFWLVDNGFWRQWMHTQRNSIGQNDVIYVRRHLFRPEYCCCPYEIRRYRTLLRGG